MRGGLSEETKACQVAFWRVVGERSSVPFHLARPSRLCVWWCGFLCCVSMWLVRNECVCVYEKKQKQRERGGRYQGTKWMCVRVFVCASERGDPSPPPLILTTPHKHSISHTHQHGMHLPLSGTFTHKHTHAPLLLASVCVCLLSCAAIVSLSLSLSL